MKSFKSTLLNTLPKSVVKNKWALVSVLAVIVSIIAYVFRKKSSNSTVKSAPLPFAENTLSVQGTSSISGINVGSGIGIVNNDTDDNPSGANQFNVLDMHELRLSVNNFLVSDLASNTANAFGKNYHSFYLIMDDDSTVSSTFQNVDLSSYSGQTLMIRKFMVDSSFAPNYATFVANFWRIGRYNSDNYLLHHSQAFIQL